MMGSKYREIFAILENDIEEGRYDETRKLLTEDAYIERFNVSRNTVRRAIDLLIKRGYCFPVQGSGVFLRRKKPPYSIDLENIYGLTHYMAPLAVTNKIIHHARIEADAEIAKQLDVPVGSPVLYLERIRYVDGIPYVYEYNYFNLLVLHDMTYEHLIGSLYTYLEQTGKAPIAFIDTVIHVIRINEKEAEHLKLESGDPGLEIDCYAMIRSGEVIQWVRDLFHYKNARALKIATYI